MKKPSVHKLQDEATMNNIRLFGINEKVGDKTNAIKKSSQKQYKKISQAWTKNMTY